MGIRVPSQKCGETIHVDRFIGESSYDVVKKVSDNIDDVVAVGTNIDTVKVINANLGIIKSVSSSIDNVDTVANNISNVNTVVADMDAIKTASTNSDSIRTVSSNIVDVNTVADNIQGLIDIDDKLNNAAQLVQVMDGKVQEAEHQVDLTKAEVVKAEAAAQKAVDSMIPFGASMVQIATSMIKTQNIVAQYHAFK